MLLGAASARAGSATAEALSSASALQQYDAALPEAVIDGTVAVPHAAHITIARAHLMPHASAVDAAAYANGIDPLLLSAVIHVESHARADALSAKGARGLMQLLPATARAVGLRDPALLFDPAVNIEAGARELRRLHARFGSLPLVLAAYNAGPGAVARFHGVPPFAETTAYVARVLARYRRLAGAAS